MAPIGRSNQGCPRISVGLPTGAITRPERIPSVKNCPAAGPRVHCSRAPSKPVDACMSHLRVAGLAQSALQDDLGKYCIDGQVQDEFDTSDDIPNGEHGVLADHIGHPVAHVSVYKAG